METHPGREQGKREPTTRQGRRDRYARAPRVITWEVTRACGLKCAHCRADAIPDRNPGELDTGEGRRLLEEIARFEDPTPVVVFTGGDPLRRPDLQELMSHASGLGLPVAVIPAPTSDVDRETVQGLKDAGARRMALSLDGPGPTHHDAFRGEPGSYAAAMRAAEHAAEVELSLQVNTTVTRGTMHHLPAIADRVEEIGAVTWEVFFLVPVGRGAGLEPPDPEETEEVLDWMYRRQREAPFRVMTVEAPQYRRVALTVELEESGEQVRVGTTSDGNGFLFISHLGEVYPSGFLPVSGGNVREESIVDIYRDAPLFRDLRNPDLLKGKCGACEFRNICGGSRARAWAVTGDCLEADPFCSYVPSRYSRMVEAG